MAHGIFFFFCCYLFPFFTINGNDIYPDNKGFIQVLTIVIYTLSSFVAETALLGILGQFFVLNKQSQGYEINLAKIHTIMLIIIIIFIYDRGITQNFLISLVQNILCEN